MWEQGPGGGHWHCEGGVGDPGGRVEDTGIVEAEKEIQEEDTDTVEVEDKVQEKNTGIAKVE